MPNVSVNTFFFNFNEMPNLPSVTLYSPRTEDAVVKFPSIKAGQSAVLHVGLPFAVSPGHHVTLVEDAVGTVIGESAAGNDELRSDVSPKLVMGLVAEFDEGLTEGRALSRSPLLDRGLQAFIAVCVLLVVDVVPLLAGERECEKSKECGEPQRKGARTHG